MTAATSSAPPASPRGRRIAAGSGMVGRPGAGRPHDHLVLAGIATSGVVLSILRQAAELDYRLTVLADGCLDADPEVHKVLLGKEFPARPRSPASPAGPRASRGRQAGPPGDELQVFHPVERVVAGPWPGRRRAAHRFVAVE